MCLSVSQTFRHLAGLIMLGMLSMVSNLSLANSSDKEMFSFVLSHQKDGDTEVKVSQMPLKQVLDTFSSKANIPIHYSTLPAVLVNATCKAADLKQLLECLLDNKADLIVRYGNKKTQAEISKPVVEAWILVSTANNAQSKQDMPVSTDKIDSGSGTIEENQQETEVAIDRTERLLTKAHSLNPKERTAAVGALLAGGRKGDPDVKATLEQALDDQDSDVRAQAISSLSHREGLATGVIEQALQDSSEDVRLMAVEGITDNVALLQQAVNDSDESIRSLAEIKLELLTHEQGNKP
jgi:hypothetical protein